MKRAIITAAMAVVPFIAFPAATQTAPTTAKEKIIVATVDGENIYSSDVVATMTFSWAAAGAVCAAAGKAMNGTTAIAAVIMARFMR